MGTYRIWLCPVEQDPEIPQPGLPEGRPAYAMPVRLHAVARLGGEDGLQALAVQMSRMRPLRDLDAARRVREGGGVMSTPESTPTPDEPDLHLVEIVLCTPCLNGEGGECWSAGCALWCNTRPESCLWDNPAVKRIERC